MKLVEKIIIRFIILFLFLLIVSQFLLYHYDLYPYWKKFYLYEGVFQSLVENYI